MVGFWQFETTAWFVWLLSFQKVSFSTEGGIHFTVDIQDSQIHCDFPQVWCFLLSLSHLEGKLILLVIFNNLKSFVLNSRVDLTSSRLSLSLLLSIHLRFRKNFSKKKFLTVFFCQFVIFQHFLGWEFLFNGDFAWDLKHIFLFLPVGPAPLTSLVEVILFFS